jgi:hypothetical protein
MGCFPRVSKFWAFGVLKCQLESDMCHPPDWAMCLPVFFHVAIDRVVQRLGTPEGKDVTGCVGSKNPEGLKARGHIDH